MLDKSKKRRVFTKYEFAINRFTEYSGVWFFLWLFMFFIFIFMWHTRCHNIKDRPYLEAIFVLSCLIFSFHFLFFFKKKQNANNGWNMWQKTQNNWTKWRIFCFLLITNILSHETEFKFFVLNSTEIISVYFINKLLLDLRFDSMQG